MKMVTKKLLLALLLGSFSIVSNSLYAADSESVQATEEEKVNEYIYGADSYAYTAGKLSDNLFVMNDKIPNGYRVGILAHKFKDSSKSKDWQDKLIKLLTDATEQYIKNKKPIPQEIINDFNNYCEENFNNAEIKFFEAKAFANGQMVAEGYGCNFNNFYALVNNKNEVIPAEWMYDPNTEILKAANVQGAENAILFRWKNPEYKAPETTCVAGTNTGEGAESVAATTALKTTETFIFEGPNFKQLFQVIASDSEVSSNPEALKELTNRVVKLFKDMPKVAATIIGRMVNGETMSVCPITDEIDGKYFNANLSFDADTTAAQAKALAEKLDNMFNVLKENVMKELQGEIDEETRKRLEEHKAKLDEQEQKANAMQNASGTLGLNDQATTSAVGTVVPDAIAAESPHSGNQPADTAGSGAIVAASSNISDTNGTNQGSGSIAQPAATPTDIVPTDTLPTETTGTNQTPSAPATTEPTTVQDANVSGSVAQPAAAPTDIAPAAEPEEDENLLEGVQKLQEEVDKTKQDFSQFDPNNGLIGSDYFN